MDRYRIDTWRTARMNQHVARALATRAHHWDLWSSIIVTVCSSGAVLAVVQTKGSTGSSTVAIICAVTISIRPLFNWAKQRADRHMACVAWRRVEELCEDDSPEPVIRDAERAAHRLDSPSTPWRWTALIERSYARTNQELPVGRFV